MWAAITLRFGLDIEMPPEVKEADNRILLTERNTLMPNTVYSWEPDTLYTPLDVVVSGWWPTRAEATYAGLLHDLLELRP